MSATPGAIVTDQRPKRGRPVRLAPADIAEATSLTHADLRQARRHLAAAFRLLQFSEARLVPVIRDADSRGATP